MSVTHPPNTMPNATIEGRKAQGSMGLQGQEGMGKGVAGRGRAVMGKAWGGKLWWKVVGRKWVGGGKKNNTMYVGKGIGRHGKVACYKEGRVGNSGNTEGCVVWV